MNTTHEYSGVKGLQLGGSKLSGDTEAVFANPSSPDNAPTGDGNYQLRVESPLVNSGNNAFLTLTKDLAEQDRIYGGTIDIGAFENQGTPPVGNEMVGFAEKTIWSAQNQLFIHISEPTATAYIYTPDGRLVTQARLSEGTHQFSLAQGYYIVTLSNGKSETVAIR